MQLHENFSLKAWNSFGIDVSARYFARFSNWEELEQLKEIIPNKTIENPLILGGGSNILFTKNFDGSILKNVIRGIRLVAETKEHFIVEAGAGEIWHEFVMHCIDHNYAGLENLSLIPGTVGASPIQNIGAYGVEIKDCFHSLDAYHLKDKTVVQFEAKDCLFGYRDSIFKKEFKNQFAILKVRFQLSKQPNLKTSYGIIEQELAKKNISSPSIRDISNAVISIRTSKLPDPKIIGNAGSFFKNPLIAKTSFELLKQTYPTIPGYSTDSPEFVKIAAGWLIDQCGWKGYRKADAGCHALQALVLVNYGNATGSEILSLSHEIIASIQNKFGIELEREVNIL
ncbi:MAG: UDP-N-acetylenolpyruvoylglucosamine reductase [Chitinophagaceae bacterium BSSC1]|nr:MAG: UDP-N-acetylenolpyruvoylglucosamine reductase [Chitinophagaceae bacterium BSSC1]